MGSTAADFLIQTYRTKMLLRLILTLLLCTESICLTFADDASGVIGVHVIPHSIEPTMQYRRPRDTTLSARVQIFVRGATGEPTLDGKRPADLLASGEWSWHDIGSAALRPTPDSAALPDSDVPLHVWTINGKTDAWGVDQSHRLEIPGIEPLDLKISKPEVSISAVTFLTDKDVPQPDTIVLHIVNDSPVPISLQSLRLWLPKDNENWHALYPQAARDVGQVIPANDRGIVTLQYGQLPLTYVALELKTDRESLWAHLRIKREVFDMSGGWIGDHLSAEPYLKLLKGLHVNAGQIQEVGGYTDNETLYEKYPIKSFNRLWPLERYDTDQWLMKIHAVEFLGEPQYGGGKPVSPQDVFDQLLPYRRSRLATSVTHSEERIWRHYAGLSDYPHYDAYRIVAPAADAWGQYDRWQGRRIRWGAPLETIGDMSRSLRDLNRPMPCAYWSQGPHDGWRGWFDGRVRRSPTPDELRSQAMHALATRITSLYWFNLSLKSLMRFPDTWEAIRVIGREIQMLQPYYLTGDGASFRRTTTADGLPDWELSTIVTPDAALLFAIDTAYQADQEKNEFVFGPHRQASFAFPLPGWLREPKDVFRVDGDGVHEVDWRVDGDGVIVSDTRSRDAVYIAAKVDGHREAIEARRQAALAIEANHEVDQASLTELLR